MTTEATSDPTPALITDLDGIWWIETPTAVVFDREWLRENFGPVADRRGHDRQEPSMQQAPDRPVAEHHTPAADAPCPHLCEGGFYTVSIPIAGAVVSDRRACPIHGPVRRRLVRDSATDRVGEIRGYLTKSEGEAVWLRPRGGGKEWTALIADLEPAPEDQAAADAPTLESHGEYQCPYCSGDSLEAQIAREVYGCTAGSHCVEVTPAQRTRYNARIVEALAERRQEIEVRA